MDGVAQDPAKLAYLDAGVNWKGAPNENFAREIMEMFTLGVNSRDVLRGTFATFPAFS